MPGRVLILRYDTLEQELEGILTGLHLVGQAVNIDVIKLAQSPATYRSGILKRAFAATIDQFHRVVLFVSPPAPSTAGNEAELELMPDDSEVLTHLMEPSWMRRMILIQKGNADAGDLWRVMSRRDPEMKPRHVFGRPHGHDHAAKYVLQVAQATLGPEDGEEVDGKDYYHLQYIKYARRREGGLGIYGNDYS